MSTSAGSRVKTLYQPEAVAEIKERLGGLSAGSARQWGKMSPAQALAHCAIAMEMALGKTKPKRHPLGYVFGPIAKRSLIARGEPMRRNSPTSPNLVVADERDFEAERQRLTAAIDGFVAAGPEGCTAHPHLFFGRLTPPEWAALMYQHLDHHLRQFGA
jgi:Protein of unknown function (DUF1569)